MPKLNDEQLTALIMNGVNIVCFLIYIWTHTLFISYLALIIDIGGLINAVDNIKKNEDRKNAVISLILFIIAASGALGLSLKGILIYITQIINMFS